MVAQKRGSSTLENQFARIIDLPRTYEDAYTMHIKYEALRKSNSNSTFPSMLQKLAMNQILHKKLAETKKKVLHDGTEYFSGTNKPTDGWFQMCRGCNMWTTIEIQLEEYGDVPCCRRCSHELRKEQEQSVEQLQSPPESVAIWRESCCSIPACEWQSGEDSPPSFYSRIESNILQNDVATSYLTSNLDHACLGRRKIDLNIGITCAREDLTSRAKLDLSTESTPACFGSSESQSAKSEMSLLRCQDSEFTANTYSTCQAAKQTPASYHRSLSLSSVPLQSVPYGILSFLTAPSHPIPVGLCVKPGVSSSAELSRTPEVQDHGLIPDSICSYPAIQSFGMLQSMSLPETTTTSHPVLPLLRGMSAYFGRSHPYCLSDMGAPSQLDTPSYQQPTRPCHRKDSSLDSDSMQWDER